MPQLIGVKPLSQFCVDCVTNNMAVLCKKPTATNNLASIDQDADHNIFDPLRNLTFILNEVFKCFNVLLCFLASKFLEEIIDALLTKKCLNKFLGFLATPQLQNLDLRLLRKKDDCSNHFKLESLRCVVRNPTFLVSLINQNATFFFKFQYLKQLVLWPSDIDATFFTAVIPMFVKLQVLDISKTAADDSCLELIGTYCTYLR